MVSLTLGLAKLDMETHLTPYIVRTRLSTVSTDAMIIGQIVKG